MALRPMSFLSGQSTVKIKIKEIPRFGLRKVNDESPLTLVEAKTEEYFSPANIVPVRKCCSGSYTTTKRACALLSSPLSERARRRTSFFPPSPSPSPFPSLYIFTVAHGGYST